MEKITLRESQAPYTVTLDENTLHNDVTFLEQDGAPVAFLLPARLYETFRTWQRRQQVPPQSPQAVAFAQERAVFEQMLPQLLRDHPGKVVANYQGKIVEVGDEIGATLERSIHVTATSPAMSGELRPQRASTNLPTARSYADVTV